MHRIGKLFDIVIRQHQACRGFDMRGKYYRRFFRLNLSDSRLDCHWLKLLLLVAVTDVCGQDSHVIRDTTFFKDLRPAKTKKTVTDDEHCLVSGKLARNRFHTVSPCTRHDCHRIGVIHVFQTCGQIIHHGLEFFGHVIERAVGVDHRVF